MSKNLTYLAVAATALALAGCGGGGGGSSTTAQGAQSFNASCSDGSSRTSTVSAADAQAQCPVTSTAGVVTSVPTPSYGTGSQQLAAFNLLNSERQACGFGLLAQNTKLDQAAQVQAQYTVANDVATHVQTSGGIGFSAATVGERIAATGYASSSTVPSAEIISFESTGAASMRTLLTVPYHGLIAVSPYLELGLGFASDATGSVRDALAGVLSVPQGATAQGSITGSNVLTYPCEGTVGVRPSFPGEFPNPLGARNYSTNPAGPTIMAMSARGSSLLVSSATVTNAATGTAVPLAAIRTASSDTTGLLGWNSAFIIPDQPLVPSTRYVVTIAGTVYPGVQGSTTVVGTLGGTCTTTGPGMTTAGVGLACTAGVWVEAAKSNWTRSFGFTTAAS